MVISTGIWNQVLEYYEDVGIGNKFLTICIYSGWWSFWLLYSVFSSYGCFFITLLYFVFRRESFGYEGRDQGCGFRTGEGSALVPTIHRLRLHSMVWSVFPNLAHSFETSWNVLVQYLCFVVFIGVWPYYFWIARYRAPEVLLQSPTYCAAIGTFVMMRLACMLFICILCEGMKWKSS
jgi:hypothetical protein